MNKATTLSAERARELLSYDPETGVITWRVSRGRGVKAGDVAGGLDKHGYGRIRAEGANHFSHRLAFLLHTRAWPQHDVDHINGSKSDNRWANLRDVPQAVNNQNTRAAYTNSSTGVLGVRRNKLGKLIAHISVNGGTKYLGSFSTPEPAHQAYLTSKRELHAGCTI